MSISFEDFERAVMQKMCDKKDGIGEILWEQYKRSNVIKREFTGVGFFTYFSVPKDVPLVTTLQERSYGDVVACINGSTFDFGFVVFLKDGIISSLEGYTWTDNWPEVIHSYDLKHVDSN